jgi:type IV pilus assembly protein PilE
MNRKIAGASRRQMAGMTLLELMAVVVVIGILGMIAIPSYRQYVARAQRTEAKSALLRLATNQERFYLQNRTYSSDPSALGFAGNNSERGTYALTITGADANGYTATATPRTGAPINMTQDSCTSFSITAQGARSATAVTGFDVANCW